MVLRLAEKSVGIAVPVGRNRSRWWDMEGSAPFGRVREGQGLGPWPVVEPQVLVGDGHLGVRVGERIGHQRPTTLVGGPEGPLGRGSWVVGRGS